MLCNYGEIPEDADLSRFTGLTLTPAGKNSDGNTAILSDIVNGEVQHQIPIDMNTESVEETMAGLYPTTKIDMNQIPLDEDGEIDYDNLPDIPEDYQDKVLLVDEDLMDALEENLDEYPYPDPDNDEDDSYDEIDALEQKINEAKAEEAAAEAFERFCNRMCDAED